MTARHVINLASCGLTFTKQKTAIQHFLKSVSLLFVLLSHSSNSTVVPIHPPAWLELELTESWIDTNIDIFLLSQFGSTVQMLDMAAQVTLAQLKR